MKTTPITAADIARTPIAVPPLARKADLTVDAAANAAIIRHVEAGGIASLMYGGNANFYNVSISEYAGILDFLAETAGRDTWVLPSAGPDFGKLRDQAAILKSRKFPTAMVLPATGPFTAGGVARAIRHFSEAIARPVVVYLKDETTLTPDLVRKLVDDRLIASLKYAVIRKDPTKDDYLTRILEKVDRSLVASGAGERPTIAHMRTFGLPSFTTGLVCIAPRASLKLHSLCKAGKWEEAERLRQAFLPLEDLRDEIQQIAVLHDAVELAGVARTGPLVPLLDNVSPAHRARIAPAAEALVKLEKSLAA